MDRLTQACIAGLALATLTMAGCSDLTAEAKLEYDGNENGSHSEKADCDDQGEVSGSGTIHDGALTVTVEDDSGSTVFDETFSDSFSLDDRVVRGDGGAWVVRAERSGDDIAGDEFNGDYEIFLDCQSVTGR